MRSDLISIRGANQVAVRPDGCSTGVNTHPISVSIAGDKTGRLALTAQFDMFLNGNSLHRTADVPRWFHFLFALVGAALAVFIRWLLDPILGNEIPFMPLCVAVAAV